MPIPAANRSRFSLTIRGVSDDIRVTAFSGRAEISGLYTYDISVASKRPISELKSWLDRPTTLTLHGDPDRHIHGLIMQVSHTGQGREFTDYRISIVPRLWRLTQSKNHRIFQDRTPNQIITLILKEHGIQGADLQDHCADGPIRPYCVQYGETDFAFVSRLMEEEGWHFHFHQQKDRHILVVADRNTVFASKSGAQSIRYEQETSRAHDEDCIHTLDFRHQITGGAVRLGDFDFSKPGLTLREASTGWQPSLEHYDHPGLFDEPGAGSKRADIRLQQAECLRRTIHMECHITTLDAGQWFTLTHHPNPALNQQYIVTCVAVTGTQSQAYGEGAASSEEPFRCTIECIPAQTPFRPPHQWRKPTIKGPHSAIVTGPKGEEIYTDQHGRIKVQFHWDREGQANETTSCWVRVNQPIAGIQWGGIAIPRIGQEVIIEFEHGDPDRPVMTGRVYNGQGLPPYPLPQHKTRSVLKTLSSPGGGGFNEIRIEDKKGSEQIFLRAEKNMDLRVKHSARTQIGRDRHLTINNEDFAEINGDLHQSIGGAVNEKIGQSLSLTVGQDLQLNVSGALVVQAGNAIHIKAGSKAVIQGGMSLSVKGGAGVITIDPSGVAIVGPLVRINEGGGGGSAKAANPTVPGEPGEADNAIPGSKLRAASGPVTPVPDVIDFDKARSQLASFQQANTFAAPLVEECPECLLAAAGAAGAEAIPPSPASDTLPNDCLDLVCIDADGSPAKDLPYTVTLSNGSQRKGTLDGEGKAHLTGLTPGAVTVEYQPDDNEAEINAIRNDISTALNEIIQSEKTESAEIQAEYEQKSALGQWWEEEKAKARGVGSAIGGFFSMLKEVNDLTPMQQLINAHKVAWESWRYTDDRPYLQRFTDNLTESQFKDVIDVMGFDPRSITREKLADAWATANFVWDDADTQTLLLQFAGDFIAAQHKLEIMEGAGQVAGEVAIDILITALTLGAGATISAGRKIKLLEKFKKLGPLFEKLAEAIKKRRKHKSKGGQTGSEIPEQLERPHAVDAEASRKKALDEGIAKKRVSPSNLTDAKNILAERRNQIAANGYQPKYSDEELKFIAENGNIGSERYQVRFMETKYLDPDNQHLSGAMGRPMEGESGAGAKYWSTSFDQLEDADTDPKLISEKLGLTYDPEKDYTLVIVDTQKATPITGVKSVSATFDNVSDFANTELPAKFPKAFTDTAMTPAFQAEYAKHYKAAEKSGYLKQEWSSDKFSEYLNTTSLSEAEKELMIQRFDMHEKIGNNEDYLGNGLTKNNNSSINQQYGVVETLNFERKKINLSQLDEIDAITLLPGLRPI